MCDGTVWLKSSPFHGVVHTGEGLHQCGLPVAFCSLQIVEKVDPWLYRHAPVKDITPGDLNGFLVASEKMRRLGAYAWIAWNGKDCIQTNALLGVGPGDVIDVLMLPPYDRKCAA